MNILVVLLLLVLLYLIYIVINRLLLHPLANIPGPKLAALTSWHEFFYDCVKGGSGQHAFKIREMHDRYGSLIAFCPPLPNVRH